MMVSNRIKHLVCMLLLIETLFSISTTILESLSKSDQESLLVAKELFNIVETEKYFNKEEFTCLNLFPTNLTKNNKQKVYKLNITYNYEHEDSTPPNNNPSDKSKPEIIGLYEDYDYDKILDLLHGSCVIHSTNEFLYEYCHKEKVRQFDDIYTRQRMAKTQYQDIAMGYYDYQKALKYSKSEHDKPLKSGNNMYKIKYSESGDLTIINKMIENIPELTEEEKSFIKKSVTEKLTGEETTAGKDPKTAKPQITLNKIPARSVVKDQSNSFTVDHVSHKEYELDKQNKVIHSNFPIIKQNTYLTSVQYTHEVTCEYNLRNKEKLYIAKAVVISSFELAFLGEVSKCQKVINVSSKPVIEQPYKSPIYFDIVRSIDDFMYGYVDEFCTNNWDWNMNKINNFRSDRQNYIQPGTTLWLQMAMNVSGKINYYNYPVTVKRTIASGVIKLEENIINKLNNFVEPSQQTSKHPVWIHACKVISKRPINEATANYYNKIIRKNVIKVRQREGQKKKEGDEMLCLCRFENFIEYTLEMHLTLGQKIASSIKENTHFSYFDFYHKRTVKTTPNGQILFELCKSLECYDFAEDKQSIDHTKHDSAKFTEIVKLTAGNSLLSQGLETQNKVFVIDVSQNGILKIHTQKDDQKFFYMVSTSFLFKIRVFPNGSRQIISENSFYENQTTLNYVSWFQNSLFIHKSYMWRGGDKLIFPRMQMHTQKITAIEIVFGHAYLRKLDLEKMQYKDAHLISQIENFYEKHFRIRKFPVYHDENSQQKIINQDGLMAENGQDEKENSEGEEGPKVSQNNQKIDFSKIDFAESRFKPLNKSVSVRYQYFHGDYCGQPIKKYRRTNVDLQCGQPWLKIEQVKQTSPCVYELKVSTRLLCRQDYQKAVQNIEQLKRNPESRIRLQKSVICYPWDAWDNLVYYYDLKETEVFFRIK